MPDNTIGGILFHLFIFDLNPTRTVQSTGISQKECCPTRGGMTGPRTQHQRTKEHVPKTYIEPQHQPKKKHTCQRHANLVIGSKTSRDLRSVRTSCKPFWPCTHVRWPLQLTLRCRFHFLRFFFFCLKIKSVPRPILFKISGELCYGLIYSRLYDSLSDIFSSNNNARFEHPALSATLFRMVRVEKWG